MNEGHSAAWDQEWSKAAAAYRNALQEMPDHPKALNSLGLALFQQAQFEEAMQIYKRVALVSPQDPVPMEKLAQLLERTGHLKEAIEAAFKAADLFLNQREVNKAIENWVRVTSLNPEHMLAHSRLALAQVMALSGLIFYTFPAAILAGQAARGIPALRAGMILGEWRDFLAGRRAFDFAIWRWINLIEWTETFDVRF